MTRMTLDDIRTYLASRGHATAPGERERLHPLERAVLADELAHDTETDPGLLAAFGAWLASDGAAAPVMTEALAEAMPAVGYGREVPFEPRPAVNDAPIGE